MDRGIVDLTNVDADGNPVGRIRVKWIWHSMPADDAAEAAKLKQGFEAAGLVIGEATHSQGAEPAGQSGFSVRFQRIHRATIPGNPVPQEYRILGLASPDVHVYIAALSPDPTKYFTEWAINRRAFDLLIETLH
jgi:hypothetical protein